MSQAFTALLDFTDFIDDRTRHFTGREWVFEAIDKWLQKINGPRIFLLAGGPGTGKSAIAARLAQLSNGAVAVASAPGLAAGWLTYHHFCQAGLDSTLSPLTFVQALSETLANRYPIFRIALETASPQQIVVNQNVGTVQAGGQVVGAQVKVEIRGADARPMFDLAIRRPLNVLCQALPDERIVILLDSLDEALAFNLDNNITQLLKLVNDFPRRVRFICTCRSNSERVFDSVGAPTLDLIADAPRQLDEVKIYAVSRLPAVPGPKRDAIAARIATKSSGNFLYAYHVLNDLLASDTPIEDADNLDLPDELEGVYRKFIERELALNPNRWNDVYRPLLGLIAVARGEGLTRAQLIGITELAEDTADDVFKVCKQYLVGGESDERPYRIYHQSFRDFLQHDKKYTVYPAERHAAIARYFQDKYGASWGKCEDEYALRHTPVHWAEAATLSEAKRETRTQTLIELTRNAKYQRRFESRSGDLPMLQEHMYRAVQVAALNEPDDMLPWLIKAAKGFVAFRREYLRAESITTLAEAGKLAQAESRLPLFVDIDEDWQIATRLIMAWLGAEQNKSAAQLLGERAAKGLPDRDPLPLLRDRVEAACHDQPWFAFETLAAVPLEVGQQLVNRISGQEYDRELLGMINPSLIQQPDPQSEMIGQRGYAASIDAPILVDLARAVGPEGTALIDEYIEAHAGYNYVEYRNRSLWFVLQAVLRHHPDQNWVKSRLRLIMIAALSGGGVDFGEMLPLTAAAWLAQINPPGSRPWLASWQTAALNLAESLQHRRGANDSWGNHKRRLTALMELHQLIADDVDAARQLLDRIRDLPGGFAGFQTLAHLRLIDAVRACKMDLPDVLSEMTTRSLRAAHRIQDYHFCARITARCNALIRWHQRTVIGQALADTIHRLATASSAIEFSADHIIHEAYQYRDRDDPNVLPISDAQDAETLEQLVEVFQRPAVEFRRLNPQYGLSDVLDDQTLTHIPDPGLAPLLAVHLAARVLADDSLEDQQAALIRELVPTAVNNPTALDTVLSYLLLAAKPDDEELLKELVKEAGPVDFADVAPPATQIGPG